MVLRGDGAVHGHRHSDRHAHGGPRAVVQALRQPVLAASPVPARAPLRERAERGRVASHPGRRDRSTRLVRAARSGLAPAHLAGHRPARRRLGRACRRARSGRRGAHRRAEQFLV